MEIVGNFTQFIFSFKLYFKDTMQFLLNQKSYVQNSGRMISAHANKCTLIAVPLLENMFTGSREHIFKNFLIMAPLVQKLEEGKNVPKYISDNFS